MAEKKTGTRKPVASTTSPVASAAGGRDIGIDVPMPPKPCTDGKCPFHGRLSVRGQMVEGISDLSGLGRSQPSLAFALAIFMFAMAGIPPTAGFFSKLYIFMAAIDAHLVGLAVIGVLASVVGAFYYLRVVKVMYFDEPIGAFDRPIAPELKWVLFVAAVLTMFFILLPDPLVGSAYRVIVAHRRLTVPHEIVALAAWRPATDVFLVTPGSTLLRSSPTLGTSLLGAMPVLDNRSGGDQR